MTVNRLKIFSIMCMFNLIIINTVSAEEKYTWSVVPQFTGMAVHRDWSPVIQAVEQKTGYKFELVLYDSIPSFEKAFVDGLPDIAYMNPYHAVIAKKQQGYMPIIRDGKRQLTGIIVTRKDSEITTIDDLEGKEIAFPSPNAFAASLYVRALLTEKYGINYKASFAKTHSNAYRYTLLNKTSASGGVYRTLNRERPEARDKLKVIFKTPSSASHPLVVHKRVPKAVSSAVQRALLDIIKTESGKAMMKAILIPKPIAAEYKRDYQPLEDLKLDAYVVSPK